MQGLDLDFITAHTAWLWPCCSVCQRPRLVRWICIWWDYPLYHADSILRCFLDLQEEGSHIADHFFALTDKHCICHFWCGTLVMSSSSAGQSLGPPRPQPLYGALWSFFPGLLLLCWSRPLLPQLGINDDIRPLAIFQKPCLSNSLYNCVQTWCCTTHSTCTAVCKYLFYSRIGFLFVILYNR
jgi:hypothetical protein